MTVPLLLEMYDRIPALRPGDDEELWAAGAQDAFRRFRAEVRERYLEGTLVRVLHSMDARTRQAAVLALGFTGTVDASPAVAAALHDADPLVRRFAADALWELWFRGGTTEQNRALQRAMKDPNATSSRRTLDELIRTAPHFAEAINQRAIWYFKQGEFARSAFDCEAVLRLNPYHFGAATGLGQCCLKLGKARSALRAFRLALEINPGLEMLNDAIRALEETLDHHGE